MLDDLLYLLHLFGPQICWQWFTQSTLEVLPQCFSLVEFWILTGPLQHLDSFVFFSPSVVDLLLCSGSLFIDSKVIWYTEKFMVDLPVAAKQAQVIIVIIRLLCSMLAWAAVCGPRCCAWHSPNLWFVQMQFRKTMLVVFFLGEEALSRQPFQNEPDEISRFLIVLSWILAFSMLTEACGFWDIGFAAGSLPWMDLLTSVWSVCPPWIIVPTVRWCLVSWHSVSTHLKLPKLLIL